MNDELLLLIKKHTNTMIDQTKTRRKGTLEFKMNEKMETSSVSPPINLIEEGKRLLGANSFEAANSVFSITIENKCFSNTIPGHWSSRVGAEMIIRLQTLLKLGSENDIKLHLEELEKRGNLIKTEEKESELSDLDSRKKQIIRELKNIEYNDLEYMAFRMELTYHEVAEILDMKNFNASTTRYTFPPGIYEISDNNLMLKSLLPDDIKVNITVDDNRLRSNLITNKTMRFTKRSFFI